MKKERLMHACRLARVLVFVCLLSAAGMFASRVLAQQPVVLVGAGSGLPEALYLNWNDEYMKANARTGVRYLPRGTDEGSRQVQKGIADFGGGDYPLPAVQLDPARGKLIQIPVAAAGVAIVYNIPGVQQEIRLSGPVLADIFLSKITMWNHPEIAKLNPGVKLPATGILAVHLNEGKGENYIFSDYLSRVSPEFRAKVGRGLSPKWVTGTSLARGEDVLFQVKDTDGAIGYAEMGLAIRAGGSLARVKNAAGEFVKPSSESVAAAAERADVGEDLRGSTMNAPGAESYPIASFTWLYLPEKGKDPQRQEALKAYALWALTSGQALAAKLGYAPLPLNVASKAKAKLDNLH
jgi:phosphate transport system substrate-binding protein